MVKKTTINLIMDKFLINNIIKIKELENELEHETAKSLFLKLRNYESENYYYKEIREHLKNLMISYENKYWSDEQNITEDRIRESDKAEIIVRAENEFIYKRKTIIKQKLKDFGLNQGDLAKLLGHKKGYMSELINGLRPFSKEDLIIINRLLKIPLDNLFPLFIKQEKAEHIKKALISINKKNIKFSIEDLKIKLAE